MRTLPGALLLLLLLLAGSAAVDSSARLSTEWAVLAPFPAGKTELDADPGGLPFSAVVGVAAKRRAALPSELVRDGVTWARASADAHTGAVQIEPAGVDWGALVGALNRMEVLEWAGWAHAALTVAAGAGAAPGDPVRVQLSCAGATHFYLQRGANASAPLEPHAGDVYRTGRVESIVALPPGVHRLVLRLRAKVRTEYACTARALPAAPPPRQRSVLLLRTPTHAPDVVDGLPAGGLLAVPATNTGPAWLARVACVATLPGADGDAPDRSGDDGGSAGVAAPAPPPLAMPPGALLLLPCRLRAPAPAALAALCSAAAASRGGGDGDVTVPVSVRVTALACGGGDGGGGSGGDGDCTATPPALLQHQLRCRHLRQSFVLTLRDHDGSVQSAAAVAPLPLGSAVQGAAERARGDDDAVPVALTLHGTGVTASRQADAYKFKASPAADYTFGVAGYWLLAPARHGAHNHAGTGHWHALAAVRALAELAAAWRRTAAAGAPRCDGGWRAAPHCVPLPDADRVLFTGHSMGGAGAWHAATAAADVAIAAAPLAGWLVKEGYGDANTFAAFDAAEPLLQPRLKGVLLASVQDQRADAHAGNLVGVPVHVRVGARDATTPPYLSRRMVRLLTEAGAGGPPPTRGDGSDGRRRGASDRWPRYEEVGGAGDVGTHWWWSTLSDDDGGIVNDAALRALYEAQRGRHSTASAARCAWQPPAAHTAAAAACAGAQLHSLAATFDIVSTNAHVYRSGRAGVRILQLASPGARASVRVHRLAAPLPRGGGDAEPRVGAAVWALTTSNVRRLRVPLAHATFAAPGTCAELEATAAAAANASEPALSAAIPSLVCVDGVGFAAVAAAPTSRAAASSDVCRSADIGDDAGTATIEKVAGWAPCAVPPSSSGGGGGGGRVLVAPTGGTAAAAAAANDDDDPDAYERLERGPATAGPMRAVTASPFFIVVGTSGPADATAAYLHAAMFLAQLHAAASEALAPIVNDTQLSLRTCTHQQQQQEEEEEVAEGPSSLCLPPGSNLVLLGSSAHNSVTRALAAGAAGSRTFPIEFHPEEAAAAGAGAWGGFSVPLSRGGFAPPRQRVTFSERGLGVVSTAGWWDARAAVGSRARLALVLAATDADGLWGLLRLAEPTIPPMTRAPFSNLFPDVAVASAERLRRGGADGLVLAGFYDAAWQLAPEASYVAGGV